MYQFRANSLRNSLILMIKCAVLIHWAQDNGVFVNGLPVDSMGHFDAVYEEIEVSPQKVLDYTVGHASNSWPFSFWQYKTTENAAELREFKSTLRDHNIVHLTQRPLAVYYHDDIETFNMSKTTNTKICRATISSTETYHTLDTEENTLNILYICSTGSCCGIDCCYLNITFIFALSCILLIICSFGLYFLLRSIKASKKLRHMNPFKQHRIIKRANATKKTRFDPQFELRTYQQDSDTFQESPPTRKKSQSMRVPGRMAPEVLLIPEARLHHCNSMPSKTRRKDVIL